MKTPPPTKAQKFWDRTASSYDREERGDRKISLEILEKAKVYLQPADRVLDLGCGTGFFTNEIAGSVAAVQAVDFSSKMIAIARGKAEKRGIRNIEYTHSTLFDPRWEPGSYDVILCFYILHLLDEPAEAMKRLHELLRPGGTLISVTPAMGEKPVQGALFSLFSRMGLTPRISLFKKAGLESLVRTAGFEILKCERQAGTYNEYFLTAKK